MSGSISKRSILLIAFSILVGVSLFMIGPPDITQGEYTAVVLINSDPTPIRQELNITIVEVGETEYTKTEVSTPTLNVTIDATSVLQIEPTKQIVFEIRRY